MNHLLIDIGNSRIKWHFDTPTTPLTGTETPAAIAHQAADLIEQLRRAWRDHTAPTVCTISHVAQPKIMQQTLALINECFPHSDIVPLKAQTTHGALNLAYAPNQMGADRYAQLLGAQSVAPNHNHIVVSAGTATTVDGVRANGQHVGGIILPSVYLMRSSLHQYTAQLPLAGGDFCPIDAPHNTADALATAAELATIGAIREFITRYMSEHTTNLQLIVCGGNGAELAARLNMPSTHWMPSLCLLGLKNF